LTRQTFSLPDPPSPSQTLEARVLFLETELRVQVLLQQLRGAWLSLAAQVLPAV
jgi:hypothetical protein